MIPLVVVIVVLIFCSWVKSGRATLNIRYIVRYHCLLPENNTEKKIGFRCRFRYFTDSDTENRKNRKIFGIAPKSNRKYRKIFGIFSFFFFNFKFLNKIK